MTRPGVLSLVLLSALPFPALADDDLAKGRAIFENRCSDCHAVNGDAVKVGPPLTGLFGRTSGTWPGFAYSDAMRQAAIVWSEEILAEYLKNPRAMVPKTRMNFNGLKRPGEGETLIAYLRVATAE
jgi:cytochrome c